MISANEMNYINSATTESIAVSVCRSYNHDSFILINNTGISQIIVDTTERT